MGPLLVQIPTANFSLVDLACDVCRLQRAHFLRWKIAIPPHKCAGCHRHLQGASRIRFSFTTEAHLIHHRATIYFTQIGWDAHADMKRKIKAELKKRRALSFLVPPYITVLKQSVESTSIIYKKRKGEKRRRRRRQWKGKCSAGGPAFFRFRSLSPLYTFLKSFSLCATPAVQCLIFSPAPARETSPQF